MRQRKYLYATDGKLERNGNEKWNRCAVKMTIRIRSTLLCMTDNKRWVAFIGKCANYWWGNVIQSYILGHIVLNKNLVLLLRLDFQKIKKYKDALISFMLTRWQWSCISWPRAPERSGWLYWLILPGLCPHTLPAPAHCLWSETL